MWWSLLMHLALLHITQFFYCAAVYCVYVCVFVWIHHICSWIQTQNNVIKIMRVSLFSLFFHHNYWKWYLDTFTYIFNQFQCFTVVCEFMRVFIFWTYSPCWCGIRYILQMVHRVSKYECEIVLSIHLNCEMNRSIVITNESALE